MENSEELKQNGVDFLKSLNISEISNKTFIHETELSKFLNNEFDGINKTKAMGFIQILQREYNIDLSDLKNQYISYLEEHKSEIKEPKTSLILEEVQSEERKKGFFSFIFLIASIGVIAYFINKYDLLNFSNPNDIKTAEVLNKQEVKDVKLDLEKLSQPQKPEIVKEQKKEEPLVASELNNDTENKNQEKSQDLSLNNILTPDSTDTKTQNNQEKAQSSDDLDLSKLNEDLASDKETKENTSEVSQDINDEEKTNSDAVTNELYIIPNTKVWIGTIELDTLKKKDFLSSKGKRVDIDTSKNQLLMIGHKFIKIYLNGELVSFKRKGPIRFKYIDGELIEINRREFNKLAKGKQW